MVIFDNLDVNGGVDYISNNYSMLMDEIRDIIESTAWIPHSSSKTNKMLFCAFTSKGWYAEKSIYKHEYGWSEIPPIVGKPKRHAIDFVKDGLAVEIQFGRRDFILMDSSFKMLAFKPFGIKALIELIPSEYIHKQLDGSTGWFEHIKEYLQSIDGYESLIPLPTIFYGFDAERN